MIYVFSPEWPVSYAFTEEKVVQSVRARIAQWMKDGTVVQFPTRGDKESWLVVNFGRVASVLVTEDSEDVPESNAIWLSHVNEAWT